MPERDGYVPGVPCWVDVSEPDPEAALDFYGALFSWEFEDLLPSSSDDRYFIARGEAPGSSIFDTSRILRSGDVAAVRSIPEAGPQMAIWNTYFWVDSADEAVSKVRDAGGGTLMEPFDFMDAARVAAFTDPEGAAFGIWEANEHNGARLVNDPGAVVFNNKCRRTTKRNSKTPAARSQLGLDGVDNGRIWFDEVRVPRDPLLDHYASESPDGDYTHPTVPTSPARGQGIRPRRRQHRRRTCSSGETAIAPANTREGYESVRASMFLATTSKVRPSSSVGLNSTTSVPA